MMQKLLKEPVIAGVVTRLLAMLGARYGVEISIDELLVVMTALEVAIGVATRSKVTPVKKPTAPAAG